MEGWSPPLSSSAGQIGPTGGMHTIGGEPGWQSVELLPFFEAEPPLAGGQTLFDASSRRPSGRGLANIARLCAALGHPEQAFPSIIVGGTNGKGSVTAMIVLLFTNYQQSAIGHQRLLMADGRLLTANHANRGGASSVGAGGTGKARRSSTRLR